jgi:hypothetical protein
MTNREPLQKTRWQTARGWILFGLLQLVLVTSLATATAWRERQWKESLALPSVLTQPRRVVPKYDRSEVISDEQLQAVLLKLRPRFVGQKPKINHIDHALRFWGVEAKFNDSAFLDGEKMRAVLLDQNEFHRAWGDAARPLLIRTRRGVEVRTREGNATASHTDHTLAGLVEVGTPSNYPVRTSRGDTTLTTLIRASLANFSLNQGEYEWSTLIQALCLQDLSGWTTSEGQRIDFNRLSERLMRQRLKQGVCFGNHRLYTLAALLQIDERESMLNDNMRREIIEYLKNVTARLVRNQHAYGYWDGNWAAQAATSGDDLKERGNRILATGHTLEWWAIAPAEVQPPRETLVRAGQWLSSTIVELDEATVSQTYTYLTHAGRALALWRGKTPMQALHDEASAASK